MNAASLDGRWFLSAVGCPTPEKEVEPELEISGHDWHYPGSSCELTKVGGKAAFICSSDDESTAPWQSKASYKASGDTLTVTEDGVTTTYTRCPAK